MDDQEIIALYWAREEDAIRETCGKYAPLCRSIVGRILASREDGEECLNDTWLGLWNAIPPQRPRRFAAFVARVARNLALKRYDYVTAARRSPEAVRSLEELGDCVSGRETVESEVENRRTEEAISAFLRGLEEEKRTVFLLRYWHFMTVGDICRRTGFGESRVKSMLSRTRRKLREHLEQEGIEL